MAKPRVLRKCPANARSGRDERTIEFSWIDGGQLYGGLIAFTGREGKLLVDVYRLDPGVEVRVERARATDDELAIETEIRTSE